MRLIYESAPSVGLVIGTFASVPYVHLQLESRRRHFPDVPALVSDDGSPFAERLAGLCATYKVDFRTNKARLRRGVGDLSVYVHGLDWAATRGLEVLVKMSRRFIPFHDWSSGLQALACRSQMPTFSQVCEHFKFGFRTECIGFHCGTWRESGGYSRILELVDRDQPVFVEGFIHQLARDAAKGFASDAARDYMRLHPRPGDRDGYAVWDLMPDRRTARRADLLWHDCDTPFDYHRAAALYGLEYTALDFQDANQGCGLGCP